MYMVKVNEDTCTGCNACVTICPAKVLELEEGKAVPVNMGDCVGCQSCEMVCPVGAIVVTEI